MVDTVLQERIVNFGCRSYVLQSSEDEIRARSVYAHSTGSMDDFESQLSNAGIEFTHWNYMAEE